MLVKASLEQSAEAASGKAELQRQVEELSAKVQEAAGALKAKEELKEERWAHTRSRTRVQMYFRCDVTHVFAA